MKYVKQFVIIIAISFIGEFLKYLLPLPVPASIYGMVLMFVALLTGILKLDDVKDTAKFLIEIMPLMFIPAGVGLMVSWDTLRPLLIPIIIITVVTIITVMAVSGHTAQLVLRKKEKGGKQHAESSD